MVGRGLSSVIAGLDPAIHLLCKMLLRSGWTAELGFTRVRISLMRKSDKSDLRGQARG